LNNLGLDLGDISSFPDEEEEPPFSASFWSRERDFWYFNWEADIEVVRR
jgi:hypothetical protein